MRFNTIEEFKTIVAQGQVVGSRWQYVKVREPADIISDDIPAWIELVVHRTASDSDKVRSPLWSVSDKASHILLTHSHETREAAAEAAIRKIRGKDEQSYTASVEAYLSIYPKDRRIATRDENKLY